MKKLLVLVFVMGMVSIASADVSTDVLANDVVATTAIVGDIVSVVLSNDTPVSFSGGLFDIVIEVQFGTHVAAIFTATSTPAVDAAGGFSGSAAVADAEDVSTPAVDAAGGFADSAAVADAEDASTPAVDAAGGFSDSAAVADAEDASTPTVDAADGFSGSAAVADAEDASIPTVDAVGGFSGSAAAVVAEDASTPTVDAAGGFADSAAVVGAEDASTPTVDAADGFPDSAAAVGAEDASSVVLSSYAPEAFDDGLFEIAVEAASDNYAAAISTEDGPFSTMGFSPRDVSVTAGIYNDVAEPTGEFGVSADPLIVQINFPVSKTTPVDAAGGFPDSTAAVSAKDAYGVAPVNLTPEPMTFALLLFGFGGMFLCRRC